MRPVQSAGNVAVLSWNIAEVYLAERERAYHLAPVAPKRRPIPQCGAGSVVGV